MARKLYEGNLIEAEKLICDVAPKVVEYYELHKRDLPWRKDNDPYHVWVSEIMLQQTRIEAVRKYYRRFMKLLPNVEALALVEDEKLMKLWEGLGYYSRARNLKKAALILNESNENALPKTYQELIKLPGIGSYTAGAIASICYGEAVAAVDGNVLRVISRLIRNKKNVLDAKVKKGVEEMLTTVLMKSGVNSSSFNQGIMEIGEMICKPNKMPLCKECPLHSWCLAFQNQEQALIPLRIKNTKRVMEEKTVVIYQINDKILLEKRENSGLLAGMFQFPLYDGHLNETQVKEMVEEKWREILEETVHPSLYALENYKHIFSHKEWHMVGYHILINVSGEIENVLTSEGVWVTKKEIEKEYALPTAFVMYLSSIR